MLKSSFGVLCVELESKDAGGGIKYVVGHGGNRVEGDSFTKISDVPVAVVLGKSLGGKAFEEKRFVANSGFKGSKSGIDGINLHLCVKLFRDCIGVKVLQSCIRSWWLGKKVD